jgi:hypothetical protein
MKRHNVMILLLLSLLVILGLFVYHHKNKHDNNIDIIYVDRSSAIKMACEFGGTYYYIGNLGIYNNNKCVLTTNGKPLIHSNTDTLFVYADKQITGYDKSLSPICKYRLSEEATNFAISDNEIFYIDPVGRFHVLDRATLKDEQGVVAETIKDNIIVYHYTDFIICEDINNCSISAFWNNKVVSSVKGYSKHFVYLSDNCLIHTSTTNTSTINLYKTVLSDTSNDSTINLPTGYGIVSIFPINNDLIIIGSEYPLDPHLELNMSHNLKYHQSDCIVTVNIDDYKITNTRFTKEHEIIIYADNSKAITYYNGKYLTYSLDEWKVINSQSADDIQTEGSYNFETCGDYIFVFDDNSGELLNRISIID